MHTPESSRVSSVDIGTGPRKTDLPEDVVRLFMEFQALEDERRRFMADPVDRMKFAAVRCAVMFDIEQQMFKWPSFT